MDSKDILIGVGIGVGAIIIVAALGLILALPTMWLWNWLMPTIFELKEITFWQSLGLLLLSGLLFKSSSYNSKN